MGDKMKFFLANFEEIIASIFISITTILVVVNIIMRYGLNSGIVWSEEVATGCFVWSVFIGAVGVFKHRGHVGVDIVVNLLPELPKRIVSTAMDMVLFALNSYMAYLCVLYIKTSYTKMTPVLGVSSAYISSSVLIAFIMMAVYSLYFLIQDFKGQGGKR